MMKWLWLVLLLTNVSCVMRADEGDVEALKSRIVSAAAYSAKTGGMALLVKHDGKIIWESYANGGGKNTPQRIYSGTKAYWGLAALAAAEDGLIDLDDRVADTITEWKTDKTRSQIRVRELLDFTSGLPALNALHENEYKDRTAAALKASCTGSPGKSFIYGPASLQVFHELLKRKLEKKTPVRFLEREVLSSLGLGSQRYLPDSKGAPLLASGFMQTARQWSAMGRLILKNGESVLDEDDGLFSEAIKGSEANAAYAFGFWNNRAASSRSGREVDIESMLDRPAGSQSWRGACLSKSAPPDLVACIGSYGQRVYAVPSRKLVIVRLGKGGTFRDAAFLKAVFGETKE
ncbi:MAG: beta-lactamase family protein [Verrucomicrobiaceae bacterium]|nr:beta-lactamase family protein [Verrucomicrobiaceae bacterium]